MKQPTQYSDHDQNWHWPEKTWFRERLNTIKARENEQRRKGPVVARGGQSNQADGSDKDKLKVD
jgi:hypothetical protein